MNRRQKFELEVLVVDADRGLEGADKIADNIFRRIVQERHEARAPCQPRAYLARYSLHQHAVLRNRECVGASGLAVPSRYAREAMGYVLDFDIERRRIEQIESAAA